MDRTETHILELNKPETRLLHNIIREWMDYHSEENEVIIKIADELAESLYKELRGENCDVLYR